MLFGATQAGTPTFGDKAFKKPVVAASDPSASWAFPNPTLSPAGAASVGQTLTNASNGALTAAPPFSGCTIVAGDRVLVTADSGVANSAGIWVVTQLGDGTHPFILTRAKDADTASELPTGAFVVSTQYLLSGTVHSNYSILVLDAGGVWDLRPNLLDIVTILTSLTVGNGSLSDPVTVNGELDRSGTPGGPALVPVGTIAAYGGTAAPNGWLLCNGASVLRSTYADLFAVIGTAFGSVDGTHFTLPDLRGRFPLGKAASGTGSTLGGTGGSIDHTHTSAAHTHSHNHQTTYDQNATGIFWVTTPQFGRGASTMSPTSFARTGTPSGSSNLVNTDTDATSTTPGATGTNNPPFQAVNYIIKV